MIIDHSQTKSFLDFCNDLEKSKTNFPHYKKLIKEHQEKANQQILLIKSDAPQLLAGYQKVISCY